MLDWRGEESSLGITPPGKVKDGQALDSFCKLSFSGREALPSSVSPWPPSSMHIAFTSGHTHIYTLAPDYIDISAFCVMIILLTG